jgi:hypothetical protein
MEQFRYEGEVYVRPIGRGVELEETNTDLMFEIERLVGAPAGGGWEGRLRITIDKLENDADA